MEEVAGSSCGHFGIIGWQRQPPSSLPGCVVSGSVSAGSSSFPTCSGWVGRSTLDGPGIWKHTLHNQAQPVGWSVWHHALAGTGMSSAQTNYHKEKMIFTWCFENTKKCFAFITDHSSCPNAIGVTSKLSFPYFWESSLLKCCTIKSHV